MIIDSQIHIWKADVPSRPWPQPPRGEPHTQNGFSAEEALQQMDENGVSRAIIVPPIYAGDENANITAFEACERHPTRFKIMGRFDPSWTQERLEDWKNQPNMLGLRLSMGFSGYRAWMDDGTLDWMWPVCEHVGIPIMLSLPHALPQAKRVADRYPGLTLIIDHLGALTRESGGKAFVHFDDVLALASCERVAIKVTSAPNFSVEDYPFRDVHPWLKRIFEAFGSHRMLWGTDFTRLRGTYEQCLRLFQDELDFLSNEDKEWILGKSAGNLLNWPE